MEKTILNILLWVLFLGGLFGLLIGLIKFFGGAPASEYGVMGIGGGFWLLSSAIVIFIKKRIQT